MATEGDGLGKQSDALDDFAEAPWVLNTNEVCATVRDGAHLRYAGPSA